MVRFDHIRRIGHPAILSCFSYGAHEIRVDFLFFDRHFAAAICVFVWGWPRAIGNGAAHGCAQIGYPEMADCFAMVMAALIAGYPGMAAVAKLASRTSTGRTATKLDRKLSGFLEFSTF